VSEFKLGMANVTFVMRQSKYSWLGMTSAIIEPSDGGKIEVNTAEAFDKGVEQERERILAMKKDIINCVIDYGLTPEKYERVCNDIDALIKGESNV
jgi:hypothetical protein